MAPYRLELAITQHSYVKNEYWTIFKIKFSAACFIGNIESIVSKIVSIYAPSKRHKQYLQKDYIKIN